MISSFYFPHGTLTDIVDINNKDLLIPIESLEDQDHIVSMCCNPIKDGKDVIYEYDKLFINKINKLGDNGENNTTKFYKLVYGFGDGFPKHTMIIPEFVRLYTRINKVFLAPSVIRKTDVMVDYGERDIKIYEVEQCEKPYSDFVYKLSLSNSSDKWINFYYNGLLAAI